MTCLAAFLASPFFSASYPIMEAAMSLSGIFGLAFFMTGVFATTASYTHGVSCNQRPQIVAFALFAMRDKTSPFPSAESTPRRRASRP